MRPVTPYFLLAVLVLTAGHRTTAEPETGPVLKSFGPVYTVSDPAHLDDPSSGLRGIFDVGKSPEDPSAVNPRIETVARFLNLHAEAGFPRERLDAILVLHGASTKDALTTAAYRQRHGVDNPNLPLLRDLRDAGVEIYLCGQSAAYRKLEREEIAAPVQRALSAMTVLLQAQAKGYGLIAF